MQLAAAQDAVTVPEQAAAAAEKKVYALQSQLQVQARYFHNFCYNPRIIILNENAVTGVRDAKGCS
jgi:hypothetical protein